MKDVSFSALQRPQFPPFAEVLTAIGSAGYTQVEGYGAPLRCPLECGDRRFKAGLDRNGLSMPTRHFGLDMLESDAPRVLEIAEALGIRAIYCPYLMRTSARWMPGGWRAFGARLQAAGKPYRDAGLDFGWHNHDFEFHALADARCRIDQIFAGGPDLSWEADIAWIVPRRGRPFAWISKYPTRITAVHVKDIAPKGENADEDGWADVGEGTLDWKALIQALSRTSAKYFVAEHDNPSDFRRSPSARWLRFQSY
ncbi:TIM barrel protein [Sinorhizobium meliloti]|nr:TIM barrel protein [Sinorhizobium meliloti]